MVLIEESYLGNPVLDKIIGSSSSVLFYGVAGAGKTTLLLALASNLCSRYTCIYVTTEDTAHYERVAKSHDKYSNALFTEAYDLDSLIKVALATAMIKPKYVFVDSINAPFRLEAMSEGALTKYAFVVGLLLEVAEKTKGKLFASAQVRAGESGDLEISGSKVLDYYFDAIIGVFIGDAGKRYLKPLKLPEGLLFEQLTFRITSYGVEWVS